jgi:hypothetical protein
MSPSRDDLQCALDWRKTARSEQQDACVEVAVLED